MDKFKLKIFLWYLITEPFRQIWHSTKETALGENFYQPKAWMYIFIVGFIISLLERNFIMELVTISLVLLMMILKEYESGRFMEAHRRNYGRYYKPDIKEKLKEEKKV